MAKQTSQSTVTPAKREKLLRTHSHRFLLNDKEEKALLRFVETYGIANKSKFMRETLMMRVIQKFEEDQPTLF